MLKRMVLVTMGVFGAASMAVAGAPITTITTTMPRLRRLERPVVHAKKPNLIPKVPRVGTNMRVRDQQSGTQPRIRGLPGHRGRTSSGRRLMVPQHIVPIVKEARLPDLVIRSAVIRPAKVCRSGAPVLYVTARVVNIGRGASTAKPSVGMVQARNTGGVNWGNGHGLPALAPGASASVRFPVYYLQSNPGYMRGTHTFKLTVNAGKWLHESNYANNGFRPVRVTLPPGLCGAKASGQRSGARFAETKGMVSTGRRASLRLRPAQSPPNLGILGTGRGEQISGKCADLRKLVAIHETVFNSGGPLAAHHANIYVREYHPSGVPFNDAHFHSPKSILIPPMTHNTQVEITIMAGTTEAYRGKVPGEHYLGAYLMVDGKKVSEGGTRFYFPKGYCQPKPGSVTHGNMPDLIPQVSNPFNGIIKVKNIGGATAGASKLTVNCEKVGGGFVAGGGDCPSTPTLDKLPSDASGALLESVPALHAGQVYTIALPVQGLKWAKGKYRFTYKADATHAVAESNESNNVKNVVRQR